ncbi:hypothetical protein H4217_008110, partial [Coemansia sp. RSA 1939]
MSAEDEQLRLEDTLDNPANSESGELGDLFGGNSSDAGHISEDAVEDIDGSATKGPATGIAAMPKIPKRGQIASAGSENQGLAGTNSVDHEEYDEEADPTAMDDAEGQPQQLDPKQAEIDAINKKIDAAL